MKQDYCKDKQVMDQVIQKAQNDDFFRFVRDILFRQENTILTLKKERDEARRDSAVAEKNHIDSCLRPNPIVHQKAFNGCVECDKTANDHELILTVRAAGAHTMEATLQDDKSDYVVTVYIKCLELNENSFLKYASEAIDRLMDRTFYTGKVVCADLFDGAKNLRAGKIYEIKNGYITDDEGPDMKKRFSTIEELCDARHAKFIPLID